MQRVSTMCGSPLYMAPEILNHKKYDSACDIWALGMILFEMLYGYHPCGNCKDIDELISYVSDGKIQIPTMGEINNTLDDECIDLLNKMLEIDDKKRITLKQLFEHPWFINIIDKSNIHSKLESEEFKCIDTKPVFDFSLLENDIDDLYCSSDDSIKIVADSSRSSICMFELDDA